MTPEENEERARQAAAGMADFMARLDEAIHTHQRGQKDPAEPWDEHDYEKFLKESDARTDKYRELLEKYGDSDKAEAKIAREWDGTASLLLQRPRRNSAASMKSTPPAKPL